MGKRKLYKGRYFIAVYADDEDLVGVFDTIAEIAAFIGSPVSSVATAVSRMPKLVDGVLEPGCGDRSQACMRWNGRELSVFLFSA